MKLEEHTLVVDILVRQSINRYYALARFPEIHHDLTIDVLVIQKIKRYYVLVN